jgi:putative membrane protein insertion efficiency factor
MSLAARLMLLGLRLYRLLLSPLMGGHCRYIPSCSVYAEEAVKTWGPWRGAALAAWRLLRCHPFSAGGVDLVPARALNNQFSGDRGGAAPPHPPSLPARRPLPAGERLS